MKRILNVFVLVVALGLGFAACFSNNSTPKDAAMKTAALMKSGDYEKMVDGFAYGDNVTPEQEKEVKAMLLHMLKEKGAKSIEQKGGIKDVSFVSEEIDEEEKTATVVLSYTYGDGSTNEDSMNLIKTADGWKPFVKK